MIDQLDMRETGGYSHEVIDVRLDNGEMVRALVYAATPANPYFDS